LIYVFMLGLRSRASRSPSFCRGGTRLEPEAVVPGFDDMTVMSKPIEQSGCHIVIPEHACPFAKTEIRGDDDARTLIKFAQQVKEQSAPGYAKREVAKFVEDHEIAANQPFGNLPRIFPAPFPAPAR
jgi:hypothetical protein